MVENLLKDIRHSLRMFRENRGFTIAAVAALAVGIGLNTAIFSVVSTVLLKPVPFPDPDRLVLFMNTFRSGQAPAASPAKYNHWRAQSSVVQDAAAFTTSVINLTGDSMPEQLHSGQVSAAYFRLFGVPLVMGRAFSPQEDAPRGPRVALISEGLWKRRFGADPAILSKTILLGGDPHPVIGVVASTFDFRDFGPQP